MDERAMEKENRSDESGSTDVKAVDSSHDLYLCRISTTQPRRLGGLVRLCDVNVGQNLKIDLLCAGASLRLLCRKRAGRLKKGRSWRRGSRCRNTPSSVQFYRFSARTRPRCTKCMFGRAMHLVICQGVDYKGAMYRFVQTSREFFFLLSFSSLIGGQASWPPFKRRVDACVEKWRVDTRDGFNLPL